MTIRGILLDFYGTVVEEDDAVISAIVSAVIADRPELDPHEVASRWGALYFAAVARSSGAAFRPQRAIAVDSLTTLLTELGVPGGAEEFCAPQFAYWRRPELRPGSRAFVADRPVPICIVSNIDRPDLEAALEHLGIDVDAVVTSDDVRAYKPRPEMFHRALELLGLDADEVLHVGDSRTADVAGANALGIPVAWIRTQGRTLPDGASVAYQAPDLARLTRQMWSPDPVSAR